MRVQIIPRTFDISGGRVVSRYILHILDFVDSRQLFLTGTFNWREREREREKERERETREDET